MDISENLKREILIFLENNKYDLVMNRGVTAEEIADFVHELRGNYWCRNCGHDFCEC